MVSGQRRKLNSEWLMGRKLVLMRFMQQVFSTRVLATVQIVTEIVQGVPEKTLPLFEGSITLVCKQLSAK